MRRIALIILPVLFIAGQLFAQNGLRIMESLVMHSRILNHDVKYSVCLPENYYKNNQAFPVVYMLHGLGDDETAWLEYGRISQYYDAEIEEGTVTPMIFIMPQGYRTYYVNDYQGQFMYRDMFLKELVPYIDSIYKTIPDPQHRGLIGYSMGGFGALVMHLQHPDVFGSAVPLSISIRTDEQYMVEYAPEWDEQWGRLFGAVGIEGPGRITDYYKQNNPFYIIPEIPSSEYDKYHIYIDNGDKEQTLCRSNEELHILMRNAGFPHEYRVREGGHSFFYWCSALPNGLHFLSDAFEGIPYRGDIILETENDHPDVKFNLSSTFMTDNEKVMAFVPDEFYKTSRLYPALYLTGSFDFTQIGEIVSRINMMVRINEIGPMMVITIPEDMVGELASMIPQLEDEFPIRKDYHFRSIMAYKRSAEQVCDIVMNQVQFSSCVLIDAYLHKNNVINMINEMPEAALKKTPFFIFAPDKGDHYEGNGNLHMLFRDKEIRHEYRVGELDDWGIGGLEEMIYFVSENFHR
jgi:enterochelin esterase-like enzyme